MRRLTLLFALVLFGVASVAFAGCGGSSGADDTTADGGGDGAAPVDDATVADGSSTPDATSDTNPPAQPLPDAMLSGDDAADSAVVDARPDVEVSDAGGPDAADAADAADAYDATDAADAYDAADSADAYAYDAADAADAYDAADAADADDSADAYDAADSGPAHCADGGAPPCVLVLATGQTPFGIAVNATDVYWANTSSTFTDGGTVRTAPIGGGTIRTVAAGEVRPLFVALDATSVWWVDSFGDTIYESTLDGGAPVPFLTGQAALQVIAVDETNIYWAGNGTVNQVAKVGPGSIKTLASDVGNPQGPFLHGTDLYFSDFNNGLIEKVALGPTPGAPVIVASGQELPGFIAFDATNLYWYNVGKGSGTATGSIMMQPLDNPDGGAPTVLAQNRLPGEVILVDGSYVYWAEEQNIMRLTLPSGAPTLYIAGTQTISDMKQDATNLYWSSQGAGAVYQAAKY